MYSNSDYITQIIHLYMEYFPIITYGLFSYIQVSKDLSTSFDLWKKTTPDSKFLGANMGPTWVLSAPDGPHVGPMNLAIRDATSKSRELIMAVAWK